MGSAGKYGREIIIKRKRKNRTVAVKVHNLLPIFIAAIELLLRCTLIRYITLIGKSQTVL
jgi:hypothetical protein